MVLELRLQLAYSVLMQVVWGMSYANVVLDTGNKDNTFRFGNPYIVFHYQGKKNEFSYRVGVGGTIPAATLPDDSNDRQTAALASSFRSLSSGPSRADFCGARISTAAF